MVQFLPFVIEILGNQENFLHEGYLQPSPKWELHSQNDDFLFFLENHLLKARNREVTGKFVICSERETSIKNCVHRM